MKLKAICIDCDGTIVDSEPHHWRSWQHTLKQWNIDFTFDDFAQNWIGIPAIKLSEHLVEKYNLSLTPDALKKLKEAHFVELCKHEPVPLVPGIKDTIQQLSARSIPLAVVSGGFKVNVLHELKVHDLTKYFDIVVTGDDVTLNKPNPEGYLKACQALNVKPEHVATIEDSKNGILAAKSAGLCCYAYQHPFTERHKLDKADLIKQNHKDILSHIIENLV